MIEIHDDRVFDQRLQDAFGVLSSDYNPKHVDPARARNMFFGRQVVHGLHLVLWALERVVDAADPGVLESVRCTFSEACAPGEHVTLAGRFADGKATVEIHALGRRASRFVFAFRPEAPGPQRFAPGTRTAVRTLAPDDIAGDRGSIPLTLDRDLLAALFPGLAARADPAQIAVLLASTRLVGMECPGLNSIFTGLKLQFAGPGDGDALDYHVDYWNADLRLLKMQVAGPAVGGVIEAILHPPDVAQPSAREIAACVGAEEFAGQHALVVGGSRGLGETVAKIVAMGGGQATITYHSSTHDAQRVEAELEAEGARCGILRYDALDPGAPPAGTPAFTQIYYFATPRIRPDSSTDAHVAAEYRAVYSDGPRRLLDAFAAAIAPDAVLYYPSTIFVEQTGTGFDAYAGAKREGETAVRDAAEARGLAAVVQRLPRLRTGQSSALMDDDALETLPTMLETVRRVTQYRKERGS